MADAYTPAVELTDGDTARLRELGYEQELRRGLRAFENVAMGFAAISPVVALYGVVVVAIVLSGPVWVWVLPVALAGQCLLLAVYAELASEFPIAGELFLSGKTVESHLRNIFIKLGVSSRVEVARAIERADRSARSATSRHP